MKRNLLEIKTLEVSYGQVKVLRGIDLNVEEGQIVSIVGANGAGKSTLINTISGILKPTAGTIKFDGVEIAGSKPHVVVGKGITQVPEGRGILNKLTVKENLLMGANLRQGKKSIEHDIEEMFHRFPILAERKNQPAGVLSGGEQQLLAISRALMAKPKMLLLDEPSMGLAPLLVREVFNIVKGINQAGVTVLLVEQNAKMALRIAHQAYVIENGTITIKGTGKELLSNNEVIEAYLGA